MMPWIQIGIAVLLGALAAYYFIAHRNTKKLLAENKEQVVEYKSLFEAADTLHKEAQTEVRALLSTVGDKNVLLEREKQVLEAVQIELGRFKLLDAAKDEELAGLKAALKFEEEQYNKLLGQKKSSEVRTGKITEQISPFLSDYPLDSSTARFIGDPIDFVHFDDDKISFVEVKSGKSQLSKKQRNIRDLVEKGKVEFVVYRVEGK